MDGDLKWIAGIAVTVGLAMLSVLVGGFWRVLAMIRGVERESKEEADALHARINKVRDETVHKSDLDHLAARIDTGMSEMRRDQQASTAAVNQRLDAIMSAVITRNSKSSNGE